MLLSDALWQRVDKSGDCWIWTGSRHVFGYGTIRSFDQNVLCHRLAWESTYGPIPEGMAVCHKCDNPPCCRPEHLFLGTLADNNRDRAAKGRGAKAHRHPSPGMANGNAVLTDAAIRDIRSTYAKGGISQQAIAEQYGVSQPLISRIVLKKGWRHIKS